MISDTDLFCTRFISVPKDFGSLNPGAVVAGAARGALAAAGFPARVTAHYVAVKGRTTPKTTLLIKFEPGVVARERRAAGGGG